jgi:hypothetical protein
VRSLAAALTCLIALPAAAGPLVPTKASQVAILLPTATTESGCGPNAYPVDTMRKSDGTVVPFVVAPKEVFVVTSVDVWGEAEEPNRRYYFSLGIDNTPGIPGGTLVVGDAGLTDSSGGYAASMTVPTGAIVPSGVLLCSKIDGPAEEPTFVRVHGFFSKAK